MEVNANTVSPGYISLMGVPFVRGRDLEPGERNAVLVNRAFARRFWSGQNPVGRRLGRYRRLPRPGSDSPDLQWSTVVGVVEDGHFVSFREDAIPIVFQSMEDDYSPQVTFHMRGVSAEAARRGIERIDPAVPVVSVTTMSGNRRHGTVAGADCGVRERSRWSRRPGACLYRALWHPELRRGGARPGDRPACRARCSSASNHSTRRRGDECEAGGGRRRSWRRTGSGLAPLLHAQFSGAGGVDLVTLTGAAACLALVASVAIGVPAARALRIDPAEVLRVVE